MAGRKIPPAQRFWRYVSKADAPDGCWRWTGYLMPKGYGHFQVEAGASRLAHRYAYTALVEPVPKGLNVLHHCDTPACVRPDHLLVGTQKDNMADAVAKGRQAKGEALSRIRTMSPSYQKLSAETRRAIQMTLRTTPRHEYRGRLCWPGHITRDLAQQYGVSLVRIYQIGRQIKNLGPQG